MPRSVSTAFEKMMAHSNCFNVVSEPFIDIYKKSIISKQDFEIAQREFYGKCQLLIEQSDERPVFVKDMAYHALPFLTDEFLNLVHNTFLIRDPHLSIPSLYKMRAEYSEDQTGFEGQYKLFKKIQDLTGERPLVIDSENLTRDPESIVSSYFQHIGYKMPNDVLSWPPGAREEWADRETWHVEAINSRGFVMQPNAIDYSKLPKKVLKSIERNMVFYEQMKNHIFTLNP